MRDHGIDVTSTRGRVTKWFVRCREPECSFSAMCASRVDGVGAATAHSTTVHQGRPVVRSSR